MKARTRRRISRLPRWAHRLYAHAFGYFWLPCPACSRRFGGHEWLTDEGAFIAVPNDAGTVTHHGICPACTRDRVHHQEGTPA